MPDTPPIDMAPFFARHDRTTRRAFAATIAGTLAVSVGSLAYGVLGSGAPRPVGAELWLPMLLIPLFAIGFRAGIVRWTRNRQVLPDGTLPVNADDARSARRVANAGAIYVAGVGLAMIAAQASIVSEYFDALDSLGQVGDWLGRVGLAAVGCLTAYFGNAWPRMPTPRSPDQKPATQKTFNRLYGWIVAIFGLLLVLAALLLPGPAIVPVIGVLGLGLVLGVTVLIVWYYRAMKSPSAT